MKAAILYVLVWGALILEWFREHHRNSPHKNPFRAELSGREKWLIKREILTKLWTGKNK